MDTVVAYKNIWIKQVFGLIVMAVYFLLFSLRSNFIIKDAIWWISYMISNL